MVLCSEAAELYQHRLMDTLIRPEAAKTTPARRLPQRLFRSESEAKVALRAIRQCSSRRRVVTARGAARALDSGSLALKDARHEPAHTASYAVRPRGPIGNVFFAPESPSAMSWVSDRHDPTGGRLPDRLRRARIEPRGSVAWREDTSERRARGVSGQSHAGSIVAGELTSDAPIVSE